MSADSYTPNMTIATTLEPMMAPQVAATPPAESAVVMQTAEPNYLTKAEVLDAAKSASEIEMEPASEVPPEAPKFNISVARTTAIKGGTNNDPMFKFDITFEVYLDDGSVVPVSRTLEIDSCNLIHDALKQTEDKVTRLESVENKTGESQAKIAKRMRELAGIPHRGNFV